MSRRCDNESGTNPLVVCIDTFVGFSDFSFTAPILTEIGELVVTIVSELVVLNAPLIPPFVEWTLKLFAIAPCRRSAVAHA